MVEDSAIIILGASGDLAQRKLMPALRTLYEQNQISGECLIVGSGRTPFSDDEFRDRFKLPPECTVRLFYHQHIAGLKKFLDGKGQFRQIIIFFSLPPGTYLDSAIAVHNEGFRENVRLIIEKPFGRDHSSARELNRKLEELFGEESIFRIDHYLAKEVVQNILVFRFANNLFYPVWNSRHIESIQINALEEIGVVERGRYFDEVGIVKDMVQNHLLQLLLLLTMEAPITLKPEDIRTQKINLLKSLQFEECATGQYSGYRRESGIPPDSTTETFAELRATINNFRWTGMPIHIRVGKALHRSGTEIGVRFHPVPKLLFNETGQLKPNQIIFKVQPEAGILLDLSSKKPGSDMLITETSMEFCYRKSFDGEIPEAYQKLLLDALKGDHTLFVSAEETELAWNKIESLRLPDQPFSYEPGSRPPAVLPVSWIEFDKYISACADVGRGF
ncbi:MAG: glucose-6-phosphate dehydrogenase (NADP(+)) [Spirochaetales bacterium]|nr:MAG: glucose-6-phosphate dehydrogenase (NADP(+)) [Spirochaetales bacterium]